MVQQSPGRMNDMAKIERKAGRASARLAPFRSTETFSKSFSKGVRNCSSKQCQSTLNLFGKLRNFQPQTGHEPPDSDLRLKLQTPFGQGVTNSQTPSASKSASNFWTRR